MPFLVEAVFPERTFIRVGLIIVFAVETFKCVRAWLTLLGV